MYLPRNAAEPSDEIVEVLGIDDMILTYNSEQWIRHNDGAVQRWDVGMHFAEEGPGPRFGSIQIVVMDHHTCPQPVEALNGLGHDLLTVGTALYDSTGNLRHDLWEDLAVPGKTVIVDTVELDARLRGRGLGVLLTGMALDYLSHGSGVIALFPGPLERDTATPYETACLRLGKAWAQLGFTPYRDGVWILDPGLTTLKATVHSQYTDIHSNRWRVTFRPSTTGWGSDIAQITTQIRAGEHSAGSLVSQTGDPAHH
ncbi:hypothetical protein [Streptomyces sp. NPDC058653]|uniref:hypothetical protein n=1 Tax=Streptomyces sp. NPDC058653 TaxID=3346576 RepID=UPI0036550CED